MLIEFEYIEEYNTNDPFLNHLGTSMSSQRSLIRMSKKIIKTEMKEKN